MHCSFVFAGNAEEMITYHVERVRDGRSFCTRFVRAIQGNRPIFLATISFTMPQTVGVSHSLAHSTAPPVIMLHQDEEVPDSSEFREISAETPYLNKSAGVLRGASHNPQDKRVHQWIRARGEVSVQQGGPIHVAALAFMSDSYFLAAVPHSHESGILFKHQSPNSIPPNEISLPRPRLIRRFTGPISKLNIVVVQFLLQGLP
jgi:acyl-CoA thioesterase II